MDNMPGSNPGDAGSYPEPPAIYVAYVSNKLVQVPEDWWPGDPVPKES